MFLNSWIFLIREEGTSFYRDRCCHLVLCSQLSLFYSVNLFSAYLNVINFKLTAYFVVNDYRRLGSCQFCVSFQNFWHFRCWVCRIFVVTKDLFTLAKFTVMSMAKMLATIAKVLLALAPWSQQQKIVLIIAIVALLKELKQAQL